MEMESLYKKYLSSTGITTDTRNIQASNIFFALKGEKFNANEFAEQAFIKGAAFVVADEIIQPQWQQQYKDKLILVPDVLKTLQGLSGYHRQQLKCPVLAITGSNGKTTTKELIAAVIAKRYKTYATKGNLNNHIGIPLTLLSIKSDAEFAIIEMGANHQGEIASYCEYVSPDYGLITNVGLAHIEGFGGFEGVVKGKTELYRHLIAIGGTIFVSADNEILLKQLSGYPKIITYGKSGSASCIGTIGKSKEFLSVVVSDKERNESVIQTNLVGDYNFENVMSAVCIGTYFNVPVEDIKHAIETYEPTNNRSQKITYGSNTIILDAYNANPSSMEEALKNFSKIDAANKITILGEMMELGEYSLAEHEKIAVQAQQLASAKKIFVGKGFAFLKGSPNILYFEKSEDLKKWFKEQRIENSYLLIKGSRKNELEKILTD